MIGVFILFHTTGLIAQTTVPIPDTLSGSTISLMIADSSYQFFPGQPTATIGYNGAFLGPTILLNKGQHVNMEVMNMLMDTTTTHWHGLHVSPANDGSPHTPIFAGTTWQPDFTVLDKAGTYWYHPHLHGKTMEQVLLGAAGMIIVRDSEEATLNLPRRYGIDDLPLALQWKTFDTLTNQLVMNDELDNAVMVNGAINGQLDVPAQMVRLRILNGSSHRFFYLAMNDNRNFNVIAGDESLLNAPVSMNRLMVSPGERYEIVVDFSGQAGSTFFLRQLGTSLPAGYPGGPPDGMGMMPMGPLDNTDFDIMRFNVQPTTADPITSLPAALTTNTVTPTTGAGSRSFLMQGVPMMSMTNFTINGAQFDEGVINFQVEQDSVLIWNLTNQSMMPHPWHIHGNYFYINSIDGSAPPAHMQGRKDVVTVAPMGGTAQIIMKFEDFSDAMMPYMYHCHILSHEDNGMMGQFLVTARTTDISMTGSATGVSSFPNPSNDSWTITGSSKDAAVRLSLLTITGVTVQQTLTSPVNGRFMQRMDASALPAGVYLLKIEENNTITTIKLLKR